MFVGTTWLVYSSIILIDEKTKIFIYWACDYVIFFIVLIDEDTIKAVAETLRISSTFLKVSEDGTKVGRVTELAEPEEVIKQLDVKQIAASPLEFNVKLEDVESFFAKYAKVTSVRLPRHVADSRVQCGTALVDFSSEEDAAKILNEKLTHAGVELELKSKC